MGNKNQLLKCLFNSNENKALALDTDIDLPLRMAGPIPSLVHVEKNTNRFGMFGEPPHSTARSW